MTVETPPIRPAPTKTLLRLDCLPAGACYVCSQQMVHSSGGKWLCKACGFLLTCCDP